MDRARLEEIRRWLLKKLGVLVKMPPGKTVEDINPLEYLHCNPTEVPKTNPWGEIYKDK